MAKNCGVLNSCEGDYIFQYYLPALLHVSSFFLQLFNTPQFLAIFAFLFYSYVHLCAFLEFVHCASLLHARPRELAVLYCNITMTAGLFSYRVLLSDLGKRWWRTSAGSHFGRF